MRAASNRGNGFAVSGDAGDANGSRSVRKSSAKAAVACCRDDRIGMALIGLGIFTKARGDPPRPKGIRAERRGFG